MEQPQTDPYLEIEYKECADSGRFIAGVRFSFFAAFLTFFAVIIGGYAYVWALEKPGLEALRSVLLVLISLFGYLIALAGRLIETRNTRLNDVCVNRAITLERQMTEDAIRRGHVLEESTIRVHELMNQPAAKPKVRGITATHGVAISLTYRAIEIIWYLIFIYSIYELLAAQLTNL